MALRIRGRGENEIGRSGRDHGKSVRNERMGLVVVLIGVLLALRTDRIREAMTEVDASVSEAHSCKRAGHEHVGASLVVFRVEDRSAEVLVDYLKANDSVKVPGWPTASSNAYPERFANPDVADWIRTLVDRALVGARWTRRSLERMAADKFPLDLH